MNKTIKWLLPLLAIGLTVGLQAKVMESSVATVNGQSILSSDFDNYYQSVLQQYQAAAPQVLQQPFAEDMLGKEVLRELISRELMRQAAEEAKIQVKDSELDAAMTEIKARFAVDEKGNQDPKGTEKRYKKALKDQHLTPEAHRKQIKDSLAVKKLLEAHLKATVTPVEEADVKALYEDVEAVLKNKTKAINKLEKENPARFQEAQLIAAKLKQLTAAQARVGHIYLAVGKDATKEQAAEKEALAKQIKKELDGGKDFSKAVQEYTEDKAALASGGDMILIKGMAPKEIDTAAFTLAIGKVSAPIKSQLGWHIIKVKEKRSEKEISYEDIAQDLAQYLAQQRIQLATQQYINSLVEKADIKVTKTFAVDKEIEAEAARRAAEEAKKEAAKQSAAETDKETTKETKKASK